MFEPQGVAKWHALPSIWHPLEGPGRVYDLIPSNLHFYRSTRNTHLAGEAACRAFQLRCTPWRGRTSIWTSDAWSGATQHPALTIRGWSVEVAFETFGTYVQLKVGGEGSFWRFFFIPRKTNSWIPQHIYGPWKKVTQFVEFLRCRFFR